MKDLYSVRVDTLDNRELQYTFNREDLADSDIREGNYHINWVNPETLEATNVIFPLVNVSKIIEKDHGQQVAADTRPANCRNRLKDEGKSHPRSGCHACYNGGIARCPHEKEKN